MRFLKRLFVTAILLVCAAAALAYLLPREVHVSRSITIDAAPDEVFPLVNSLREAQKWSPWLALDPDVKLAFSGPESGVGNRLDWRSDHPNVGSGTQIITESDPGRRVASDLEFDEMNSATASFLLQPAGTGTLATWNLTADMGMNPIGRWMGLMMDRWVGRDYEKGLTQLKAIAESG